MKFVFHPEAYDEMVESARFYEKRDEGLGTRFLDAVENTIKRIRVFPTISRIKLPTHRLAQVIHQAPR